MVVFIFYGIHIDGSVSLAHLIRNQTRSFLYIFGWLLLFVCGMYRMSKKAIVPQPKRYYVGRKSKVVYSETDESDDEQGPVYILKKHKPNLTEKLSVIHSETSAANEYAKRGIKYPGGKRKTRRPKKSSRKTKHRRQLNKNK